MTHSPNHSQPTCLAHWHARLRDEDATAALGARIASSLAPAMRVYLRGELGAGKTTLVRGLLRALGVHTRVKSPSYTLVELYVVSRLDLYHFDFYRFLDSKEFEDAGFADHFSGNAVCLVEWPERAGHSIPLPDLDIALAYSDAGRAADVCARTEAGERCLEHLRQA